VQNYKKLLLMHCFREKKRNFAASRKRIREMKRILQSTVFRAVCAIVIGALLVKFPDNTVTGITIAIGVLFLLSGLMSCLTYVQARRHTSDYKIYDANGQLVAGEQPTFPIVGIGSIILGLLLALTPTSFISALMYIIGILLVLGAINQFMALMGGRRFGHIGLWLWFFPTVILLVGIYVMVKPLGPLTMAMTVLGWAMLVYGVVELLNALVFYRNKKAWLARQEQPQQIETFEEISEDEA
jgi:uncharacterized membrane protein HdeD (DUF308 family)